MYFARIVLNLILKISNLNVHAVLPSTVKYEVQTNVFIITVYNLDISNLGNQPEDGFMTHSVTPRRLPGFGRTSTGTIVITYHFPNGIQTVSSFKIEKE
jgi:hypothetical protein